MQHVYNKEQVLTFNDWTINQGEHWLMLGDSGSGKTTLLHIMTGLLKPSLGEVVINDAAIYRLSNTQLDHFRGKHIGFVFQRPHLVKSLNVVENLILAQSLAGLKISRQRIDEVLTALSIDDKKFNYPAELSQGQLQRVSIARAVVNKPALIMADEPTSSLDDKNAAAVLDLLVSQAEQGGSTLIIATHDSRAKARIEKTYLV